MLTRENTICFGDSHSEYFNNIFIIKRYDSSSAKGLNNIDSHTQTNQKIRQCIQENPGKYFAFYFGKVDVDFVINYKYNTVPNFDLYKYIDDTIKQYIIFLESLNVSNIVVLELPISHLDDITLLNHINKELNINSINTYISDKIMCSKYTKIISWEKRNELILYMGRQLEAACKLRNYTYVSVNKYFLRDDDGSYVIPDTYIYENRFDEFAKQPHHLGRGISELYMQSLREMGLA